MSSLFGDNPIINEKGRKIKNIIGEKRGNLEVIAYVKTIKSHPFWLCKCYACGNEIIRRGSNFLKYRDIPNTTCGCVPFLRKDLTGVKFNKLFVIKKVDRPKNVKSKNIYWLCRCDCGKEKIISTPKLTTGWTKSCGCIKGDIIFEKNRIFALQKIVYGKIKKAHMIRGLKYEKVLTLEECVDKIMAGCYYCGLKGSNIYLDRSRKVEKTPEDDRVKLFYNGLDRLDPISGYTNENTVSCCKHCNFAKHAKTEEEFYIWLKKTYEYLKEKGRIK